MRKKGGVRMKVKGMVFMVSAMVMMFLASPVVAKEKVTV